MVKVTFLDIVVVFLLDRFFFSLFYFKQASCALNNFYEWFKQRATKLVDEALDLRKMEQAIVDAKRSFIAERERADAVEDELDVVKMERHDTLVKYSKA